MTQMAFDSTTKQGKRGIVVGKKIVKGNFVLQSPVICLVERLS